MEMAKYICALLLCLSASAFAADGTYESNPMVAFLCNRPSMYLTDKGWEKDDNTGCLKDPVDILNYCRKVYPHLDIRNVVEASQKATISNWCAFGHRKCRHQFTVLPFRCLVGPFQSEALLVPEHCLFDHIHDSKLCTSFSEWNQTASKSCEYRAMKLQSFSMLQPCGIDKFNGVEFVCCPPTSKVADIGGGVVVVDRSDEDEYDDDDDDDEYYDDLPVPTTRAPPVVTTTTTRAPANDPYETYMNRRATGQSRDGKWNEHQYFMKAMDSIKQHQEDKVNKMMKEWAEARQRVQQLRKINPKEAERLNKEVTLRFQKTYEALEVENIQEKKQLSQLHQQRVHAELNDKKRKTLDDFMYAIEDYDDPAKILRKLKHYIKTVQKDRLHTINRYRHLRDTDPAEAEAERVEMARHLQTVNDQLQSAIGMLDRVPKYKKKIQLQIDDYMIAYHAIDASIAVLMRNLRDNPPTTTTTTTVAPPVDRYDDYIDDDPWDDDDSDDEDDDDDDDDEEEEPVLQRRRPDVPENPPTDVWWYNSGVEGKGRRVGGLEDVKKTAPATVKPVVVKTDEDGKFEDEDSDSDDWSDDDDDDESDEEEEDWVDDDSKDDDKNFDDSDEYDWKKDESRYDREPVQKPTHDVPDYVNTDFLLNPHVGHVQTSVIDVNEPYIRKTPSAAAKVGSSFHAAPLGIAVGTVTVLVVIVAGVIAMRRRSARRRRLSNVVNVRLDPAASPEERHIAAMQMTGYENPTYKYFEGGTAGTNTA